MKATLLVSYKDGTRETFVDGDFFPWQFKNDLENRNSEYIKADDDYIKKSEIRSIKITIENGETK